MIAQGVSHGEALLRRWLRMTELPEPLQVQLLAEAQESMLDRLEPFQAIEGLLLIATAHIWEDPSWERAAAALLRQRILLETTRSEDPDYISWFPQYIRTGVEKGALHPDLLRFDLERLARAIDPQRDALLPYIGLATLYDRYLVRDPESRQVLEPPQAMWMRVAMGLALAEADREAWALRFYERISTLRYLPSTPTLFNSGTPHHQLASCYVYEVHDSLDHILDAASAFGMLAKYAGGIGASVTRIRAVGAPVRGINGRSGGLIPFLHFYDALIHSINQGGRRRGTMAAYLEPWHLEVEAFLDLRRNAGDPYQRTPSLDTALWIPDVFMERVLADGDWYLFDPLVAGDLVDRYGEDFRRCYEDYIEQAERGQLPRRAWRKVRARELYRKILAALMETGHPWITFKDSANLRSMLRHAGVIHSLNLCTEVALPTNRDEIAVCNLASVNLVRHLRPDGRLDEAELARTVEIALRGLDNAIDLNLYPDERARRSNLLNRPAGLGLMGFAELMARWGLSFNDPEAAEHADRILEFLSYHAIRASVALARERGPFPRFDGSEWSNGRLPLDTLADVERARGRPVPVDRSCRGDLDWEGLREEVRRGIRNGTVMAIAPTATIALIAGTSPSMDPYFSNLFVRSTLSGRFVEFHPVLVEILRELGLWERVRERLVESQGDVMGIAEIPEPVRRRFPTAFQIRPEALLEITARAQKWVDMGISRNLYFAAHSPAELEGVYLRAWEMGLKATYYCYTMPRMRAEPATVAVNKSAQRPRWVEAVEAELQEGAACALNEACEACQ
ncbi:ribonucleoside-diphosphate reductase subunit alpha [Thermoflexus sp.]|uniref:ribonucleoside-diphosphate reductase subunit alpha n=1 Tax=Thermoflexus sp. TaxID=1969742 RepID=UPI002ADDB684|nr:ribonucleoside-diphosphate reductase subunit alpha [Thermoflexus sp.]